MGAESTEDVNAYPSGQSTVTKAERPKVAKAPFDKLRVP
jgi:hypothetical protein